MNTTTEIFKSIVNKPGLKNMVLTIIAIALCPKFKINEISRHLPVEVGTEKTKQKRLLRFIDRQFPKQPVLDRWARFVLETVYQTSGALVPILIDETALIGPFQAIVAAGPFRQRAIVIYFKVYTNKEIQSMKIVSHNVLVQKFCWRVSKITTSCLVKKSKPLLIFDRGFARAEHIMQWLMRRKIRFLIRVCKNTGLEFEGNVTTLNQLDRTGYYPKVVYHRTLKLRLNLYVARDNRFDDPMYLVTNSVAGLTIYLCYKRRMQIEHGFRDLKTTFGFRHLVLINETKKRVELLWLLLCITCGLLMLQYEKSGYRWSGFYCSGSKTKSLIWVIKTELSKLWKPFLLNPFFTLPLFDGDIVQLC
jgi:hypothetical protein